MYKQGSSKEITILRDEGARLKSEIEELKKENEQLKAQIKTPRLGNFILSTLSPLEKPTGYGF